MLAREIKLPATLQNAMDVIRGWGPNGLGGCSTYWRWWETWNPREKRREQHLRPEGCGHERLCSMCGPAAAAAARLGADAVDLVMVEFLPAARKKMGRCWFRVAPFPSLFDNDTFIGCVPSMASRLGVMLSLAIDRVTRQQWPSRVVKWRLNLAGAVEWWQNYYSGFLCPSRFWRQLAAVVRHLQQPHRPCI